jgi:hypothetical protein
MRKNEVVRTYDTVYEDECMHNVDRAGDLVDRLFAMLSVLFASLVKLISIPVVRRAGRYVGVALCFFCFLGLVGGIEQGLISAGLGVVVGLLLIFVEILCLR